MISNQKPKMVLLRKSTIKTRFTARFLVSLSKIRRDRKVNSLVRFDSTEGTRKRSHVIKIAAYSSMAHAVGSRRAWSRALLLKLRNRARVHRFLRSRVAVPKKKKMKTKKVGSGMIKANTLRKLVPGGKSMDMCGLLEETAHYIKCLATQVKVMQSIVDQCSIQG
ncbi:ILI1 binding bHLH 1 [Euphorbia peplus]|nr:ILI1 binding bHLH 1 [Euphorbia peplus]